MFYVYILKSLKDNKYYIGSTNNIERRLLEHDRGQSKSTRHRLPLELIYQEEYITYSEACIREKVIKSYKSGNQFSKLLSNK